MGYGTCRPLGRLCCWVMVAVVAAFGASGSPVTTTVSDSVYLADGTAAQGNLIISWPAFVTSDGVAVAAGNTYATLGANGALSVALVPNAGASPAGVYYTVTYQLGPGQVRSEYWVVPGSSPAKLATVRTTPGAGLAAQPVSAQYVNSALATKADDGSVVHIGGAETISGAKTFATSPSVPAPSKAGEIANKSYVDSSVANVGAGNFLPTAGGVMSGPITLPGNPSAPMHATPKQYVDIALGNKADLVSGQVPVSELGSGTPTAGSCLLGDGSWGACGGGGGTGNVSTLPSSDQNVAQPAGTKFSVNNFANVRYVTSGWNWLQSPADSLATAGSNTLHLSPCPMGVDTSNTAKRPYYVYVAGTGTPEAALVTGGTCTSGAASGTIIISTGGSHSNGYTVGSSTSGIQEALNDAGTPGAEVVIPPTNGNANALPVYTTIYAQTNKLHLHGSGKSTLLCKTRGVCLFLGDRVNSNNFNGIELNDIRFAAGNTFDGIAATSMACASSVATIALNNTGTNAIQAGDWFDVNLIGNPQHFSGIHQATSGTSATQVTYADTNCGGAGTIASTAAFGGISLLNAAVEDNGNATNVHDVYMSDRVSYGSWGMWQNFLVIDNDQAFKLDTINVDEGANCTTNYCGQAVYAPGPFSVNAAVLWLSHMQLSLGCHGNGVTAWNGNTIHISNSVIQGFQQWGVYAGNLRGGYGNGQFDDVYEEVGGCWNPAYSPTQQAITGLVNQGGANTIHGGEFPIGQMPRFAALGNNQTQYNYAIVIRDSTNGYSRPLKAGFATVDSGSPAGNIVVQWPRVPGTGTVTYDVLRYAPTGNWTIEPYTGGCGGGSATACGAVATAVAQCSTVMCSFTDNAGASTTSYNVHVPQYMPGILWWPGGIVDINSSDYTSTWMTTPTFMDDINVVTPLSPIISEAGLMMPQTFAQRCSTPNGGEWVSCLAGNSAGNNAMPGATVLQFGVANGGPTPNLKGRLNFTSSQASLMNSGEIITLVDSNPAKTFATPGNRPAQDAADTFLGIDTGSTPYANAGLAMGAPASISSYINSTPNGTNFLERLTAGLKTFNVPVNVNGNFTVSGGNLTLPITGTGSQCLHVSSTGVVSGTGSDCGSGDGSAGTGTVNNGGAWQVAMYSGSGAAVSGDALLTDNGGMLSYTGLGGISAGSATFAGNLTVGGQLIVTGPWQITTPVNFAGIGAAPSGQSQMGVSNDGNFYISANGGAPSQVLTASTLPVPSVFGRIGAVMPQAGDYTVAQITGAAPTNSPTFSGTVTEPVPVLPSQGTNLFFASPSGSAGAPAFRAITAADVPTLNQNTTGTAAALSVASVLPSGTTAATASAGDSSTKVATTGFVASGFAAVNPAGSVAANDYVKGAGSSSVTDSGVLAGPYPVPWITAMRGGGTATFAQNVVKMWGVVLTYPLMTSTVIYNVTTADTAANSYDIGIACGQTSCGSYSAGQIVLNVGATAATTFAGTTGGKTLSWLQGQKTLQPGKYFLVLTTNCASACAAIAAGGSSADITFQNAGTAGSTSGGALSNFAAPADAWSWGANVPAVVVK
jgi:hypothetical protein